MKLTKDVHQSAAEQGMSAEKAIHVRMEKKLVNSFRKAATFTPKPET
jgi:hypothetical protein